MSTFKIIRQKLEEFVKRYYTNELIKGAILFFAIGLLYFIITVLVEYFLWLEPGGRTVLFWTFVAVEAGLFIRFIAFPLLKLFNLQQGISHEEASRIIGNHFPEVSDKLLNVIQLNRNQRESELLAASIDQKASQLQPIPFKRAVNFKKNARYLKYAAIPVLIYLLISVLGEKDLFSSSYKRVVNYQTAYEPPAPFSFVVMNESLQAIENKPFTIRVRTEGKFLPQNASIEYKDETYYLQQSAPGLFEYTFTQPLEDFEFRLKANKVTSRAYMVDVMKTPAMREFEMHLDYPSYTGKRDEVIKSTGSATVPEGTRITWNVLADNTTEVALRTRDSSYLFANSEKSYSLNMGIFRKLDYAITTSNDNLKDYENLSFTLGVIKDEYPEIDVQSKQDTSDVQTTYFLGRISDDYGLTKLQLVYFPVGEKSEAQTSPIPVNQNTVDQFVYTFPGTLPLEEGMSYEYYFEVFDNDAIHRYKSSKSRTFTFRKLTGDELEKEQLKNQEDAIRDLSKTLDQLKQQDKTLEELSKLQKEKKELNWNDKKKLENFIKRQKQQEDMMKNFSKEMKENLEKFQPENSENDPFKEQLDKRLEENEERLKENERLLEELEKLQDKIQKEELTDKLEKLAKQNKNQEKNLEQLLELTKRYYVTKKAEKLSEEIQKLGEEQEQLADKPEEKNTQEAQEKLNEKFEEYKKEMDELEKENEKLKEPMDIPTDEAGEKIVDKEQQKATENLQQQKSQDAKKNQKNAGKKMKEMGKQMMMNMMSGGMEAMNEDVEMLRQILDNLVVFSFEQESLMEDFKVIDYGNPVFGRKLNVQNDLKQNFQHIDDSLFALSLRQPLISAPINESITEVHYNLDKALERLAENEMRQGLASQQYTVTGANELAIMLSDMLNNMQNMMMQGSGAGQGQGQGQGQGSGQGKGFQLPDIIKKQESLSEEMQKGMGTKEGENGEGSEGESGGEGNGEKGENGRNGKKGEGNGEGGGDGDGDGDGNGGSGNGEGENNGQGDSEDMNGLLYEIYKQQQQLRQQLQDKLSKEGLRGNGGDILRKMEQVEQQLLDKGFNERTLEQMLNLKYELLKLEEADFEQGQESRRESQTNRNIYSNDLRLSPEDVKKYFNSTEILNREALPMSPEYKQKVQSYFKRTDD